MKKKFDAKKILKNIVIASAIISVPIIINNHIFNSTDINKENELDNYFNWRFGKIRYIKIGKGKPLLLIHNTISGMGIHEWANNIIEFSKNNTVYILDLLGYGYSDKPKITYNFYLYVSLINDFINNIIKEKTTIIASGNSGAFSILATYLEKSLIGKLILISPTGIKEEINYPNKLDNLKRFILELPLIGSTFYNITNSKFFLKRMTNKYFENISTSKEKFIEKYYLYSHSGRENAKNSTASYMSNYFNINIKEHLKNLKLPFYIIFSEENQDYEFFKNNFSEENYIIIEGGNNIPHINNPVEFLEACKKFL